MNGVHAITQKVRIVLRLGTHIDSDSASSLLSLKGQGLSVRKIMILVFFILVCLVQIQEFVAVSAAHPNCFSFYHSVLPQM